MSAERIGMFCFECRTFWKLDGHASRRHTIRTGHELAIALAARPASVPMRPE